MDGFASLAVFPDRIRADMAADTLRAAGLPVLIRAPRASGLFSIAHADPLLAAELFVPSDALDEARSLIATLLDDEDRTSEEV